MTSFPNIVQRILAAGALAVLAALGAFCLFAGRPLVVSLVSDDAFYYLQVARHLADAGVSSFDGITRTTGYHPLYALVLAAARRVLAPTPDGFVRFLLLLNAALHGLTAGVVYAIGRRLGDRLTGSLAALFYALNPNTALWPLTGMEASVNAFAVSLFVLALVSWLTDPRGASAAGAVLCALAAALAVLARTDNAAVAALGGLLLLAGREQPARRRWAAAILVGAGAGLALASWMAWCRFATGEWIQGSARIKALLRDYKTFGMPPLESFRYSAGIFANYLGKTFAKVPALKYVLAVLALRAGRAAAADVDPARRRIVLFLCLLPLVLGLAYSLELTRAATWYYVPPVLGMTLVTAYAAASFLRGKDLSRAARRVGIAVAILVALEGVITFGVRLVKGRNLYQRDILALAEWAGGNLPHDARVGAWDAGIYSYYSGLTVINLDGLMNNDIFAMMNANRPLWPEWKKMGIDSVETYELWYAGRPEQYWQYWTEKNIRFIVGSTRWLNGIPRQWNGFRLEERYTPELRYNKSPKAVFEIVAVDGASP